MFVVPEHWQTTRPAVRERSKFIFNNDLFSDVKFVVGKKDSESRRGKRRKLVIPAHKLVLAMSSPVFEAMFYGKLAETSDTILNFLTVTTTVCWSCFVTCTAMK